MFKNLFSRFSTALFKTANKPLLAQFYLRAEVFGKYGFAFNDFLAENQSKLDEMIAPSAVIEELREVHLKGLQEYAYNDGKVNRGRLLEQKHYPDLEEWNTYITHATRG